MQEIVIKECPYCGGNNFGEGYQLAQGSIVKSLWAFKASKVIHIICKDCGSIVHSRIEDPERLQTIKQK